MTEQRFGQLWGRSSSMQRVFATLKKVAPTDLSTLITGHTGTGKELAARATHEFGLHPNGPFVVLDCGAIQQNLIESELFGHERSAFTGAEQRRQGAFELAHGGTVFLDEIGELPLHLQPKLLRVLERREIRRLGGTETIAVDVRVIAATHRDLPAMVKSGAFREDLYWRLAEVTVHLPPLTEREGDIIFLAERILEETGGKVTLSSEVQELLKGQAWPGNVRQLKNVLKRAGLMCEGEQIELGDIQDPIGRVPANEALPHSMLHEELPLKEAREKWIAPIEKKYLEVVMKSYGRDLNSAAEHVGVHRKSLERLLRKHDLQRNK